MNITIVIATCISALAMLVIAWYAYQSHQLAKKMGAESKEYRKQVAMLFKAVATSNLLTDEGVPGSDKLEKRVNQFNRWNEEGLQLAKPK